MLFCLAATGQSPQETVPYTLHVYTDLVQIPALVLGPSLETLPLIDAQRFNVSLDSGPLFRPAHVRLEGDDPITLAILLDLSNSEENSLIPDLGQALAALVPASLHPNDHVSIYALDCGMIRSANNIPADADEIQQAVDAAIQSPVIHGKKSHAACGGSVHLWNALSFIVNQLATLPGRRVILSFTVGFDGASTVKWSQVEAFAASESVAIFGVNPLLLSYSPAYLQGAEHPFSIICSRSGGLILRTSEKKKLPQTLSRFVELVRGRYILEFPRPDALKLGMHTIAASIEGTQDLVLPSGITVPMPDPAILADPTTIPSDPSRKPPVGKRHVLKPQ
jgi:hypothetical protein